MLCALSGCGALPTITPHSATAPRQPPRIEAVGGPLSVEQSRAILQRLKSSAGEIGIFDRHLALEEVIAGSPLTADNSVTLLQDGAATFVAMFAAIRNAKDHINFETYMIEDDEIGNRFASLLIEKQAAGVQVNLIYDSVGSLNTSKDFFKRLTDAGVNVVEFNPVNPLNAKAGWNIHQRDHRKLLIVDGHSAFLGGINISSVYSGGSASQRAASRPEERAPWRDTHLLVEGPAVAEFQKMFLATWAKQLAKPLAPRNYLPRLNAKGKTVVRAIASSPDEPYTRIYATLISAIRSAETKVYLTNAYFVPDPQLLGALVEAAQRGVDVRLVLPSHTDWWLVFHAGRSNYSQLLPAGVKIYERRDRLMHAKTALIDDVWSTVGSTNLDWRSFLHNDEVNAVVLGPAFGAQMRAMFEKDMAASNEITPSQWARRPLSDRIKELTARLWQRAL